MHEAAGGDAGLTWLEHHWLLLMLVGVAQVAFPAPILSVYTLVAGVAWLVTLGRWNPFGSNP